MHVLEEFVFPGGFAAEFKRMASVIHLKITNRWLIVTNILFLSVVTLSVLINTKAFGLSVITVTFINGLLHIGKSIQVKRYFPGLVTAILFYIPAGVFAFCSFNLSLPQKVLCFLIGFLMHLTPFVLLITVFKSKRLQ